MAIVMLHSVHLPVGCVPKIHSFFKTMMSQQSSYPLGGEGNSKNYAWQQLGRIKHIIISSSRSLPPVSIALQ